MEQISLHQRVKEVKRYWLSWAITESKNNKAEAARLLGIKRTCLVAMLRQLGMQEYLLDSAKWRRKLDG